VPGRSEDPAAFLPDPGARGPGASAVAPGVHQLGRAGGRRVSGRGLATGRGQKGDQLASFKSSSRNDEVIGTISDNTTRHGASDLPHSASHHRSRCPDRRLESGEAAEFEAAVAPFQTNRFRFGRAKRQRQKGRPAREKPAIAMVLGQRAVPAPPAKRIQAETPPSAVLRGSQHR